jgi:hypothetical protein
MQALESIMETETKDIRSADGTEETRESQVAFAIALALFIPGAVGWGIDACWPGTVMLDGMLVAGSLYLAISLLGLLSDMLPNSTVGEPGFGSGQPAKAEPAKSRSPQGSQDFFEWHTRYRSIPIRRASEEPLATGNHAG